MQIPPNAGRPRDTKRTDPGLRKLKDAARAHLTGAIAAAWNLGVRTGEPELLAPTRYDIHWDNSSIAEKTVAKCITARSQYDGVEKTMTSASKSAFERFIRDQAQLTAKHCREKDKPFATSVAPCRFMTTVAPQPIS